MGANRDLGGGDDDEDDNGYGPAPKKEWYETRFYKDMTEFYRAPNRQRMQTKPSKMGSKMGSVMGGASFMLPNLQASVNGNDSPLGSPLRSPGKSPKRGRLGRTFTEGEAISPQNNLGSLADTDFGLPKIEEDSESVNAGGIVTYHQQKTITETFTNQHSIGIKDVDGEECKVPSAIKEESEQQTPREEHDVLAARQKLLAAISKVTPGCI